jgi:hypothetical protein
MGVAADGRQRFLVSLQAPHMLTVGFADGAVKLLCRRELTEHA